MLEWFNHKLFTKIFFQDKFYGSYTWLAMPTQGIFYVCFVASAVAALDKFEMGSGFLNILKGGLSTQGGSLSILFCISGTIATLTSTLYEEWFINPLQQQIQDIINVDPLIAWRSLSSVRAFAALLNWLLPTLSPNNNLLLKQIRNSVRQHPFTFSFPTIFFSTKI